MAEHEKEKEKEKKHNLNYKIIRRRTQASDEFDMDYIDVEWTASSGPVQDTVLLPMNHPPIAGMNMPPIEYKEVAAGERAIIHDQLTVKKGTPQSTVMQMLEEKRQRLAENLGIKP